MRRGADWLIAIQNPDGGWGENCDSYKLDYKGYEPAPSTASQTAWALLGLMAAGQVDHPAVARGIAYLQAHAGSRRAVEPAALYRRRLPARLLSQLSRLSEILPALGAGALPQSQDRQFAPGRVRALTILAVTGLKREAEIVGGAGRGRGGGRRRCGIAGSRNSTPCMAISRGVISIGLAGALSPHLKVGDVVIADQMLIRVARPGTVDDIWRGARWRRNCRARIRARSLAATRSWKMPRPRPALYETTGALAVDMESQVAARFAAARNLPLAALRVISDDAAHALPPAALVAMKPDGGIALGRVLGSLLRKSAAGAGADPHRARLEQGVRGITPLPRPLWCWICRPGSLTSCARHGGRRRIPPAAGLTGRYPAPSGLRSSRPRIRIGSIFSGCLIASVAAVPSKPQWTMQLAHFSYLPTPYFSHSVPSISSLKVLA